MAGTQGLGQTLQKGDDVRRGEYDTGRGPSDPVSMSATGPTHGCEDSPESSPSRREALSRLAQEMSTAGLSQRTLVFGEGNPDTAVVIIGEAPGKEEEIRGRPFVGPAGQMLDSLFAEVALRRDEMWTTNVVKWRPVRDIRRRVVTRAPNIEEVMESVKWLEREIDIIKPRILLCLGSVSAKALIDRRFEISRQRGQWRRSLLGPDALATFHPSYLLRVGGGRDRLIELVLRDLRAVKEKCQQHDSRA